MTEPHIREYTENDIPALISLWMEIFGDSRTLVETFFRLLPKIGSCMVAESSRSICGMASMLTDCCLAGGSSTFRDTAIHFGYLYGVAVRPEYRGKGIGAALSRAAAQYARAKACEYVSTLPADAGLYSMYEKTIGTSCRLKRAKVEYVRKPLSVNPFKLIPAEPEHYFTIREALLRNTVHLRVSKDSIAFLKALCIDGGGDLFASTTDLTFFASFTRDSNTLRFAEFICEESNRDFLLNSFLTMLDAEKAVYYLPSLTGEDYLAHNCKTLSPDTLWDLTFD